MKSAALWLISAAVAGDMPWRYPTAARIVAIGDNYNDLDMFEVAAVSVAVRGGPEDVQRVADRLADPVEESGVAAVLEEIAAGEFPLPGVDREESA